LANTVYFNHFGCHPILFKEMRIGHKQFANHHDASRATDARSKDSAGICDLTPVNLIQSLNPDKMDKYDRTRRKLALLRISTRIDRYSVLMPRVCPFMAASAILAPMSSWIDILDWMAIHCHPKERF
jgi:hypothetical protein